MAKPAIDGPHKHRILLVDDHPMVRSGLIRLLSQEPDFECSGEAATAAEAMTLAEAQQPEVAIVDLRLKQGDGLELIKTLKTALPRLKILVLSQHVEQVFVERALRAGALGYVSKEQDPQEVIQAIRSILADEYYVTNSIASRLLHRLVSDDRGAVHLDPVESLTDRELGVFRLLGEGRSTREIATELKVSFKTVESHRENIKQKLGIDNAAGLISYAVRWAGTSRGFKTSAETP